jgi:hypothetical protein
MLIENDKNNSNTKYRVIYELEEVIYGLQNIKKELEEKDNIVSYEHIYYYFQHLHSILSFFPKKEV